MINAAVVGYGYSGILAGEAVVAVSAQVRPLNLGAHGLLSGQGKIGRRGL